MNFSNDLFEKVVVWYSPLSQSLHGLCIVLCFFVFLAGCTSQQKSPPIAKKGLLDLSTWSLENDGSLDLNGEWEFYWLHLLEPDEFSADKNPEITGYFSAPGNWNNIIMGDTPLSGDGYATFRLQVRMPASEVVKAIRIKSLSTAYKLYINGKKIAQNGVVGKSAETTVPQFLLQESAFYDNSEVLDVILQVANFNHRRGGISHPLRFGTAENLAASHNLQWFFDICLFGCLFIMGVYYLSIFSLNKEDVSPLFLSIVTLNFALRILVTDYYYLTQVFPGMSWELLYTIELSTIIVGVTAILLFITSLFGRNKRQYFKYFLVSCTSILFLITLLTPTRICSELVIYCQLATLLIFGYCFYILLRSLKTDFKKASIMLLGFTLLFATAVADILNANQIIYFSFLAHFGILCLIFSQSFVLSVRFSDAFTKVSLLSRELTDKNIALQRLDKLKDEFLANTTHELQTPLNGIIGLTESLQSGVAGKLTTQANKNLAMITLSSKRLVNLVTDILDFSRLKNRDILLHTKPTNIFGLVEAVLGVSKHLAANKKLKLINNVPENCPPVVGDEDRLQQILFNLVGNAIKFTDHGEITVSALIDESFVKISVSDTGIGIPPDKIEDIFQSFERAGASDNRAYGGTGLGLSITKRLVELHGGTMEVESTIDKGSIFCFKLPVSTEQPLEGDSLSQVSHEPDDATYPLESMQVVNLSPQSSTDIFYQVLVVDDDPINLQVVANHFILEEISFQTASNGTSALARVESGEKPQIVLLDIMMPQISGYEVCRRLREIYSPSELPIVMLTARNQVADLVAAYKAGANDYISKPISKDVLISRVNCQLSLKAAYDMVLEKQQLEKELFQHKQEKEHARLQMEKEKLEKLRYQLNPHFLFNALTSIRGAVLRDKQAAYDMVSHLSEFSRLSLTRASLDTMTVAQEIEIIQHYLAMEQMRFGDYLTVSIDIEPQAEELQIPVLVLQPLVENGIKYGSRTSPEALDILIEIKIHQADMIKLAVSNSGSWVEPGTTSGQHSTGTGINNIQQRLHRYYPDAYRFDTNTDNNRVSFFIIVPCAIDAPRKNAEKLSMEKQGNTI